MFQAKIKAQLANELKASHVKKFFGQSCMANVTIPFDQHPAYANMQSSLAAKLIKCEWVIASEKYDLSRYFTQDTEEFHSLRALFKPFQMSEMEILEISGHLPILKLEEQVLFLTKDVTRIDAELREQKTELTELREEHIELRDEHTKLTEKYAIQLAKHELEFKDLRKQINELKKENRTRDHSPK